MNTTDETDKEQHDLPDPHTRPGGMAPGKMDDEGTEESSVDEQTPDGQPGRIAPGGMAPGKMDDETP
jgi:hypothetical protein